MVMPPAVSKSDIDQLVLGYIAEERYFKTRNQLFDESPNLPEKVPILSIFGDISSNNRLHTILEEYVQFKTKQIVPICSVCDECNTLEDLWKILDRILYKIRNYKASEASPPVITVAPGLQRYSPVQVWQSLKTRPSKGTSSDIAPLLERKKLNPISHEFETVAIENRKQCGSARRKNTKVPRKITDSQVTRPYAHDGDLSKLLHISDQNDALAFVGVKILSNMKKCAEKGDGEGVSSHNLTEVQSPLKSSCGPALDIDDLVSDETRDGLVQMTIDSLLNVDSLQAQNAMEQCGSFNEDFSELRKLLEFDDTRSSAMSLPDIIQNQQDEGDLMNIIKVDDDMVLLGNSSSMDNQTISAGGQTEDEKSAIAGLLAIRSSGSENAEETSALSPEMELPTISNIRSESSDVLTSDTPDKTSLQNREASPVGQSTPDSNNNISTPPVETATITYPLLSATDSAIASLPNLENPVPTTEGTFNVVHSEATEHCTTGSAPNNTTTPHEATATVPASLINDDSCTNMPPKKRFSVHTPQKRQNTVTSSNNEIPSPCFSTAVSDNTSDATPNLPISNLEASLPFADTLPILDASHFVHSSNETQSIETPTKMVNSAEPSKRRTSPRKPALSVTACNSQSKVSNDKLVTKKKNTKTSVKNNSTPSKSSKTSNVMIASPDQGSVVVNLKGKHKTPMRVPGIAVQNTNVSNEDIISQLVNQMIKTNPELSKASSTETLIPQSSDSHDNNLNNRTGKFSNNATLVDVPRSSAEMSETCSVRSSGNKMVSHDSLGCQFIQSTAHDTTVLTTLQPTHGENQDVSIHISRTADDPACGGIAQSITSTQMPILSPEHDLMIDEGAGKSDWSKKSPKSDTDAQTPSAGQPCSISEQITSPGSHLLMLYGSGDHGTIDLLMTPEKSNSLKQFSTISPSGIFSVMEHHSSPIKTLKLVSAKANLLDSFQASQQDGEKVAPNLASQLTAPQSSATKSIVQRSKGRPYPDPLKGRRVTHLDKIRNIKEKTHKPVGKTAIVKSKNSTGLYMCNQTKNMVRIEPKRQGMPAIRRCLVQDEENKRNLSIDEMSQNTGEKSGSSGSLLKSRRTRSGKAFGKKRTVKSKVQKKKVKKAASEKVKTDVPLVETFNTKPVENVEPPLGDTSNISQKSQHEDSPLKIDGCIRSKRKNQSKLKEDNKKKRLSLAKRSPIMNWSYEEIQAKLDAIHGKKTTVENKQVKTKLNFTGADVVLNQTETIHNVKNKRSEIKKEAVGTTNQDKSLITRDTDLDISGHSKTRNVSEGCCAVTLHDIFQQRPADTSNVTSWPNESSVARTDPERSSIPVFDIDQLEPLDLSLSSWAHYSKSPFKTLPALLSCENLQEGETSKTSLNLDPKCNDMNRVRQKSGEVTRKEHHDKAKSKKHSKKKKKMEHGLKKAYADGLKEMDISKFLDSLDYTDPRVARS